MRPSSASLPPARRARIAALLATILASLSLAAPAGPPEHGVPSAAPASAPARAPAVPGARTLLVEPASRHAEEAARLRREAEDLKRRLRSTEDVRASLLEQARRLDQELALATAEAGAAEESAAAERLLAEQASARAASLRSRVDALRRRAGLVVRALYLEGRDAPLVRALSLPASADGGQAGSALVRRHAALALDVQRASEAARSAASEAARRASASELLAADAASRRETAERASRTRQAAIRKLAEQAARDAATAAELDRAAEELASDLQPAALARRRVIAPAEGSSVVLPGLARREGRLPWPLHGRPRVLQPFGPVRDPRRGTTTMRNGVTLEAGRGEAIRAIAPGRVLFVDWYKGFGRTLVLDHGDGFLSVVGHADAFTAGPGDVVGEGDVIGRAGDTGSLEGPRLWLQIHHRGEAVDPLRWLSPR